MRWISDPCFLNNDFFLITVPLFFSLKKLLFKISDYCQENTGAGISFRIKIDLNWMLQLYLLKKTLHFKCFPANAEKHLTPIIQSSWMINFALYFSEAAVHRFCSIQTFFKISQYSHKNTCVGISF